MKEFIKLVKDMRYAQHKLNKAGKRISKFKLKKNLYEAETKVDKWIDKHEGHGN